MASLASRHRGYLGNPRQASAASKGNPLASDKGLCLPSSLRSLLLAVALLPNREAASRGKRFTARGLLRASQQPCWRHNHVTHGPWATT